MKHLLLLKTQTRVKKVWVESPSYKEAVKRLVFRHPGVRVNYKGAKKGNLWVIQKEIKKLYGMKMFSPHPNNLPLLEIINELIEDNERALLLVINKTVYFLVKHHRYLNPQVEAKRINLGNVVNTEDGLYYFYEKINLKILKESPVPVKKDKALKIMKKKK